MTARDKIPGVRARLIESLGREPTLTQVAAELGITPEYVRQVYNGLGLDTRAGFRAVRAEAREREEARMAGVRARRAKARAQQEAIADMARRHPEMSQAEIGKRFGVAQSKVSQACTIHGVYRACRFSPDEDLLVMDLSMTIGEVAVLLNRTSRVVDQRRRRLRAGLGHGAGYVPTDEQAEEILALFDRMGSYAGVAREVGLNAQQVRLVVMRERQASFKVDALATG